MSEGRLRRFPLTIPPIPAIAAFRVSALAASIAVPLGAQEPTRDLATLRAELQQARQVAEAKENEIRALMDARNQRASTLLVVAGRTVRYDSTRFTSDDIARVREGVERGTRVLAARTGSSAPLLTDSLVWRLQAGDGFPRRFQPVQLNAGYNRGWLYMRRPLPVERIEQFVVSEAGRTLGHAVPAAVASYTGAGASLRPEEGELARAGRNLALSWAAAGRRCATGVLSACRAALTRPSSDSAALALWYEPADYRILAVAATERRIPTGGATADSVHFAQRRACFDGDLPACARVVQGARVMDPFPAEFRTTLVSIAIERGGAESLARMRASAALDPVEILAAGAGVSADSLVAEWRRRVMGALDATHRSAFPLVASTALWCVLLVFLATRRRPS